MKKKPRLGERARSSRHRNRVRRSTRDWTVQVFDGPPLGPDVVAASVDDVLAAIEALPADLEWDDVADRIVPVFPRMRPFPAGSPEPMRAVVPPGISLGFGIDVGPAFITVDEAMVRRWEIEPGAVLERALVNIDGLIAATLPDEVYRSTIDSVPVAMLQSSQGSASAYVLRPRALAHLFGGGGQRLVIAPMRNLLVSMPPNVDPMFAAWLFEEIAAQDPNRLAPMAFRVGGGELQIEPLGEAYGRA